MTGKVKGTFYVTVFQFAPPRGGGQPCHCFLPWGTDFNSHPRVRGDSQVRGRAIADLYFNSHPRVGGDEDYMRICFAMIISIRTPAWGVTSISPTLSFVKLFQFAPPRGG